MMIKGAAVDFFVLVGYILIGTFIGAIFLKTACALFNLLAGVSGKPFNRPIRRAAGGESSTEITTTPLQKLLPVVEEDLPDPEGITTTLPGVPKPSFEWAMAIVFVVALAIALAGFIVVRLSRLAEQATSPRTLVSTPILLIFYPLSFLILSGTITIMLPTNIAKGLLVTLIFLFLAALVLGGVLACIVLTSGLRVLGFG